MQFEPWQTHVRRIFRFFSATQCCSCGKSYCLESVWFIRRSETFYGNRGTVVCQRCASTAEEAYSIATRGPHIQPGRENKKDVWLLVREVERSAGDLGHSLGPMGPGIDKWITIRVPTPVSSLVTQHAVIITP